MVSTTILHEMPLYLFPLTNSIVQNIMHALLLKFDITSFTVFDFKSHSISTKFTQSKILLHAIQVQTDYL